VDGADGLHAAKQRLRAQLLAARRARPAAELARARATLRGHAVEQAAGVAWVAGYLPLPTEPGSVELLAQLRAGGARVLVPVTLPDHDLDWAEWTSDGVGAPLGVDAIARAGLVLAPALAVATDGTRLGRGGGSYDRALARCAAGTRVAALVFAEEMVGALPRAPWDRPVDAALTPDGWRPLRGNAGEPLAR
jgi:5-formyltetrahydrofolate cyclo-ligase